MSKKGEEIEFLALELTEHQIHVVLESLETERDRIINTRKNDPTLSPSEKFDLHCYIKGIDEIIGIAQKVLKKEI